MRVGCGHQHSIGHPRHQQQQPSSCNASNTSTHVSTAPMCMKRRVPVLAGCMRHPRLKPLPAAATGCNKVHDTMRASDSGPSPPCPRPRGGPTKVCAWVKQRQCASPCHRVCVCLCARPHSEYFLPSTGSHMQMLFCCYHCFCCFRLLPRRRSGH